MSPRVVAVLLLCMSLGAVVEATFAAEAGFSGRRQDCTVCHAQAAPAATVHLDGLPDVWAPGETVTLAVSVTGGPDALPEGPRGGFELEVEAGTLSAPAGMEPYLRFVGDTIATYTPQGTELRAWAIDWTPPTTGADELGIWVAGMASNGNHLRQPGVDDDGENGDATATLAAVIPADPEAVAAWLATPMEPPQWTSSRDGDRWVVAGTHVDPDATHLGYRVNDGAWESRATDRDWRLVVSGDPTSVEVRSEGGGRTSPTVDVLVADEQATWAAWPMAVALAGSALVLRRLH